MNRYSYGSSATLIIFLLIFFSRTCARHQRALTRESNSATYEAEVALEKGDYELALQHANQALKKSPNDPIYLVNRSIVYDRMGDTQNAIIDVENAIKHGSTDPDIYSHQSNLYYDANRFDDAINAINAGLKQNPGDSKMLFRRGVYQLRMNKIEDAQSSFNEIQQSGLDASLANLGLGYCNFQTGNYAAALQQARQNADVTEESKDLFCDLLAKVYFHMGNYQAAIPESERANAKMPESGNHAYLQGLAWLMMSNPENATNAFRKSANANENNDQGYRGLALMALASGNLDEAAANLTKATEINSDEFALHHDRAIVEILKGQPQPALQHIDTSLVKISNDQPAYEISKIRSATSAAHQRVEQVLVGQYGVSYFRIHYNRALTQLMLGNADAARAEFELAKSEHPNVAVTPAIEDIIAAYDAGGKVGIQRNGWKFQVVIGN